MKFISNSSDQVNHLVNIYSGVPNNRVYPNKRTLITVDPQTNKKHLFYTVLLWQIKEHLELPTLLKQIIMFYY